VIAVRDACRNETCRFRIWLADDPVIGDEGGLTPTRDYRTYSRAFEDLDGHGFGPFWMDMAAAEQALAPVNG